jgi:lipoprotein-releasing system ATP-binding protein
MISTENLGYQYPSGKAFKFPSFSVKNGEALLILGKSGVGKTTFLHLIAALLKPQSGSININNIDITSLKNKELTSFRAQKIGVIYQQPHFVNALSVKENLLLSNYLANKPLDKTHLNILAETLGFVDHLSKNTSELSLGEQQRVSIARAIMNNPEVILADEPTSSLDDENCKKVVNLLQKQAEIIGACLIIVTHDQRLKNIFENQLTLQ